jgi:hypothetical protein
VTNPTWTGKSGQDYSFYLYDLAATFYARPGVYILCRAVQIDGITRYEALYVGEAESFEDRLNASRGEHDGFKRALKMGVTHIAARVVAGDRAQRLSVETDLRHALNPPCNAQPVPLPAVPPPLKSLGNNRLPNQNARTLAELLKR